jgi:hypothetical protein
MSRAYGARTPAGRSRSTLSRRDHYHRRMPARKRKTSGPPFTVPFPEALDARKDGDAWWFEVDGRELRLSNLNKVFWPDEG